MKTLFEQAQDSRNITLNMAVKEREELKQSLVYAISILGKIPAFGDSIGTEVSKAQIGCCLNSLKQTIARVTRNI